MAVNVKKMSARTGLKAQPFRAVVENTSVTSSRSQEFIETDPVLDYRSDVTPDSLAAVQANSDRYRGDHAWNIAEDDDDLDPAR